MNINELKLLKNLSLSGLVSGNLSETEFVLHVLFHNLIYMSCVNSEQ